MEWDFRISQWGGGDFGFQMSASCEDGVDQFPEIQVGKYETVYEDGTIFSKRIDNSSRCFIDIKIKSI